MAPIKRSGATLNQQKCPVFNFKRPDLLKSDNRVPKAKTSRKQCQGPQISEMSSLFRNNHPVPPDGENAATKMNNLQERYKERKYPKRDIIEDPFKYTSSNRKKPISDDDLQSNRSDVLYESGNRVEKAKTSRKTYPEPQISILFYNNHPEPPEGTIEDEDFLHSTVYNLIAAVLEYGCAYDVLEQNGNLYSVKTGRPTVDRAKLCEKCRKPPGGNQFMKRPRDTDFQDGMPYCERALHKIKQGKIERKCRKCSSYKYYKKDNGAGFGGQPKSG